MMLASAAASAKSAMRPDIRGREMWPLAKMDVGPASPPACRAADYRTGVRGGGFCRLNTWDSNLDFQVTTIRSALETPGESSEFMERSRGNRSAKNGGREGERDKEQKTE